jgi:hypothetical protein
LSIKRRIGIAVASALAAYLASRYIVKKGRRRVVIENEYL